MAEYLPKIPPKPPPTATVTSSLCNKPNVQKHTCLSYRHPFGSNHNEPLHEPTYVKQHKQTKQTIKNEITTKILPDLSNMTKNTEIWLQESREYRAQRERESQARIIEEREYWERKKQEDRDYHRKCMQDLDRCMQEDRDYHRYRMQDLDRQWQEDQDYHHERMQDLDRYHLDRMQKDREDRDFFTNLLNQLQAMSPPTAYHHRNRPASCKPTLVHQPILVTHPTSTPPLSSPLLLLSHHPLCYQRLQ